MTDIYFGGGENSTHQSLLISCGVRRLAVNVTSLLRRKATSWSLDLPYPDWSWVAYCDGPATAEDLAMVLSSAARLPKYVIGPESWSDYPDYLPLWNGEGFFPKSPDGVVVTDRVFKSQDLRRRTLSSRSAGKVLGTITGSIDSDIGRFDLVLTGAWWSTMKHGETQVWDGHKMWRYNADHKSSVRARHIEDIEHLGVSAEKVLLGDPEETARLAIVSWQEYEQHLSRASVVPLRVVSEVTTGSEIDTANSGSEGGALDIAPPQGRHRQTLPVLGLGTLETSYRDHTGAEVIERQTVVRSLSASLRRCDNCVLADAGCPGYSPGATCAYEIPVEIRTKDQLIAAMQAVIELQTQRVFQARFAEEITGQELSSDVGREIDRLFQVVEKMRDITDNRETLKITAEARGGAGVLSRLFGTRVGANAMSLPTPMDSEDILEAVLEDE